MSSGKNTHKEVDYSPTPLDLTDAEWLSLIDGDPDEESELGVCCGDVSNLRDVIIQIVREGRRNVSFGLKPQLIDKLNDFCATHDMTPTLKKLADQVGFKE